MNKIACFKTKQAAEKIAPKNWKCKVQVKRWRSCWHVLYTVNECFPTYRRVLNEDGSWSEA